MSTVPPIRCEVLVDAGPQLVFDVAQWTEFDRGGHFAAMEAPDLLVGDIRKFFRRFR